MSMTLRDQVEMVGDAYDAELIGYFKAVRMLAKAARVSWLKAARLLGEDARLDWTPLHDWGNH